MYIYDETFVICALDRTDTLKERNITLSKTNCLTATVVQECFIRLYFAFLKYFNNQFNSVLTITIFYKL